MFGQQDRESDVVGVLANERFQPHGVEKLFFGVLEMQVDGRAALRALRGLDRKFSLAIGKPADRFGCIQTRLAGDDLDFVGDDEGGVEADAELADQAGVLFFVTGQLLQELGGSRPGDRAEILDQFVAGHADTVVADRHGTGFGVIFDPDAKLRRVLEQRRVAERFEAQFVGSIGGIGDQLPQENLLVAV